jgi:N utilization substance protein B
MPRPVRQSGANAARRRARQLALQGLYQWLLSGESAGVIDAHLREQEGFADADRAHFDALLHGCIEQASALDAALARHTDRRTSQLSPVEHAALMIGAYELLHCLDVPYRVALNEAVELAKGFGGTDGHKFVNGVMDKVAADLRPAEVAADRAARGARGAAGKAGTPGASPMPDTAPPAD